MKVSREQVAANRQKILESAARLFKARGFDAVTVADAVAELALRLPRTGPATFRELTGHLTSRIEIIVRFLALLELCKQGRVSLDQGHTFGDLAVEWVPGAPETVSVGIGPTDEYEG